MMGPRMYIHALVKLPDTIIGPRARAGLTAAPVIGPAMKMPTAKAKPTAIGAIAAGALSSVATAITTKTSMKPMRISISNARRSLTPAVGEGAARAASLLPGPPNVSQMAKAASTAPASYAAR